MFGCKPTSFNVQFDTWSKNYRSYQKSFKQTIKQFIGQEATTDKDKQIFSLLFSSFIHNAPLIKKVNDYQSVFQKIVQRCPQDPRQQQQAFMSCITTKFPKFLEQMTVIQEQKKDWKPKYQQCLKQNQQWQCQIQAVKIIQDIFLKQLETKQLIN